MNSDMMKSDCHNGSRSRSDGRQCLSRRRLAREHSSNRMCGNWESDLALAVEESLRYARQAEREKMLLDQSANTKSDNNTRNNTDEFVSGDKVSGGSPQSLKSLKELLLLHVDLAQHQQELVIQKDKEIKNLKIERDALSCRLERMERRMALLKHKEDISSESKNTYKMLSSPVRSAHPSENSAPSERGTKRKSGTGLEPQNLNKKFAVEVQKDTRSTALRLTERQQQKLKNRSATSTSEPSSSDVPPNNFSSQKRNKRAVISAKYSNLDNSVLVTKDSYYVAYYDSSMQDEDLKCRGDIKEADSQLKVELPSWKHKTYTNLWVLEGTENLEDEIFIKRHQKPEVEEKRRKRWDMQRIREQKIYEKLKEKERGGEMHSTKDNESSVESFYSDLDNITHIEITDKIPVMAFGHAVPKVDQTEFTLPWELESTIKTHNPRSVTRSARIR